MAAIQCQCAHKRGAKKIRVSSASGVEVFRPERRLGPFNS
jgi:hypothetical protein